MSATDLAADEKVRMQHTEKTEGLWHQMHERLLSYIRRRVSSAHDAEDILQDVFVRIHAGLGQLKATHSVAAWVHQITHNAITDYYRKRATAAKASARLAQDIRQSGQTAHPQPDIERQAEREFSRCLGPLLDELPGHYRQALVLTELNGATQKQAAEQAGLSVSGMKARVQRGRSQLKDVILDCCSVELDRRGGLVDYQRRNGTSCEDCSCR